MRLAQQPLFYRWHPSIQPIAPQTMNSTEAAIKRKQLARQLRDLPRPRSMEEVPAYTATSNRLIAEMRAINNAIWEAMNDGTIEAPKGEYGDVYDLMCH